MAHVERDYRTVGHWQTQTVSLYLWMLDVISPRTSSQCSIVYIYIYNLWCKLVNEEVGENWSCSAP
uniref:Uncharacterized protein n=1 Tax=Anguilla anguilla TaxID=7936 RepID=A0A0E9WTJ9_ANGAN